jgi:hypothetical protein
LRWQEKSRELGRQFDAKAAELCDAILAEVAAGASGKVTVEEKVCELRPQYEAKTSELRQEFEAKDSGLRRAYLAKCAAITGGKAPF